MQFVSLFVLIAVMLATMDSPYLYLMSDRFQSIVKGSSGGHGLTKRYYAAVIVYLVLALAIMILVLDRANDIFTAFKLGALFGFCSYATFDFTAHFMFEAYDFKTAVIDTIWGTLLCGVISSIAYKIKSTY